MFVAITAIVITVAVLVVVVIVAFYMNNKKKRSHINVSKHGVKAINRVGVFSDLEERSGGAALQVNSPQTSAINLADRLRSRFMAMGVLAAAIFSALGIRLWTLQVLQGGEYSQKAQENLYTTVSTVAPRGYIYDTDGNELVKNRTSLTVLADVEVADDRTVVQRLSALLGIPHNIVRARILDTSSGAQAQRIVASDVTLRDVAFISEHATAFPGVTTQSRTVREYPYGALAAHVLGYTGGVDSEDLKFPTEGVDLEMGDIVGKSGVEASYDRILAGDHGTRVVLADADGTVREVISETDPTKGNDIYLTIKAQVQQVADKALAAMVAPDGTIGTGKGLGASLVCIDATDGGIVALSNYPTYTPESFIGGISEEAFDLLNSASARNPLLNRAIAGTYPAASTFKAFTGLAGLNYDFADTTREWNCEGSWYGFGSPPQHCWNLSGHGHLGFRTGVVVSCDVVFYEIAKSFYDARAQLGNTAMQDFIKRFGFGNTSGVDLGGEAAGRIPTPDWKTEYFRDVPEEAPWVPGDLSNMAIGQGYVLVTPLQMALGYVAVATGKHLKPHVLKEVRNSEGETVVSMQPEETGPLDINEEHLAIMRDALRGVATEDYNVSREMADYGITNAAAKTGTAEVIGKKDYGWFACYAPFDNPKYVVACVVEEGGAGALSACPLCVPVLDAALRYDAGTLDEALAPIPGSTGKSVSDEEFHSQGTTTQRTD